MVTYIFCRYGLTMTMGLRGRDEHRDMRIEDLTITQGERGEEMELSERVTKTRSSVGRANKSVYYCTCSNDKSNCLIELVKQYNGHKPEAGLKVGQLFYLTRIPQSLLTDNVWYRATPLGKNKLGSILPDACKLAGIPRHTNHGARRTAIVRMRKAGIPDDKIIKVTGHRSTATLAVYDDVLEADEHQRIQDVIRPAKVAKMTDVVPSTTEGAVPSKYAERQLAGATFNNCQVTINLTPHLNSSQQVALTSAHVQ